MPGQQAGNILDILLNAAANQQPEGDSPVDQSPASSDLMSNFFSKWFWLALGILTYMALASPDYSWMVADSSGSVFRYNSNNVLIQRFWKGKKLQSIQASA